MIFNINASAIARHTQTLKTVHRSALPVVVRQTLNKAAFYTKTDTMPKEANRFEKRKPTFFKANSKVVAAMGFDIGSMRATVGFVPKANDTSHSVEDLEQQEYGGQIGNRSFIPTDSARVSKSKSKMVQKKLALINIRKEIFDSNSPNIKRVKSKKEAFTLSAIYAGKGGFVLGTNRKKGNRFLMRINSIKRVKGQTKINSTAIYAVKKSRKAEPKSKYHNFMRSASLTSARKMERDFMMLAEKKLRSIK